MKLEAPTLSPAEFVTRWAHAEWSERASYQEHYRSVCQLVGAPTPSEYGQPDDYAFEYGLKKTSGGQGYADVFRRGHFAIEYKQAGKYKELSEAYQQLQQYRENLNNPPLLIVCDIDHWEIHTNFTNAPVVKIEFTNEDLTKPHYQQILRRVFSDPESFHPDKNKEDITKEVAATFKSVVDDALGYNNDPERVAQFLTKLVFCLFVEDIGLLPKREYEGILTYIIREAKKHRDKGEIFRRYVAELFGAMANGGNVLMAEIPYFNGSLFVGDESEIVPLGLFALNALDQASDRDWAHVEPSIFGTIFERTLDKAKRAQLGAHYTHPDDIKLIVEPVLMQPLRREWEATRQEAEPIRERYDAAGTNRAQEVNAGQELVALRARMLERVRKIKVLDPACGSGNFLYISLRLLLDLEKEIITHPLWAGLDEAKIGVRPTQLYGIERNEIAHALASVVVWIGYLQWGQENGYQMRQDPILDKMSENIVRADAILRYDADGKPYEPEWEAVDVIVGNPPFLGDKKMLRELGDKYVTDLRRLYAGRVSGASDLVTYWFEHAQAQIESKRAKRAGLLATNSIRQGKNRQVLDQIKQTGDIFMAWSDREWVLDGAAVRVSMVGFDDGSEQSKVLDGKDVEEIHSDLSAQVDTTGVQQLPENEDICFLGMMKAGAFDIDEQTARKMLTASNPSGKSNSEVIKRRMAGQDVTDRPRSIWIIDFGVDMPIETARLYELPFQHIETYVKPVRATNNRTKMREKWWIHGEARPGLRAAVQNLSRCIVTPEVAKHRLFVWMATDIVPDHKLHVIARQDDYFFGVLHSRLHEVWSLHIGSTLEDRPSYSSSRTFETFPFPFTPGGEDFSDPRVVAISAAARQLNEERDGWLKGETEFRLAEGTGDGEPSSLKERTLTNLYNALQAARGAGTTKGLKAAAREFAPRLDELHRALDAAVVAAYGWDAEILTDDEAILRELLALNQARAAV